MMKDYTDEHWRSILAYNGLDDFDALWALEAPWFEAPNHRRGGWSGVSRYELKLPEGGSAAIFLKRQENHTTPTLCHPPRGEPTFCREFRRIQSYRRKGVATLEPVFFGVRQVGSDQRAILATAELSGFVSLESLVGSWGHEGLPARQYRRRILSAVADLLYTMHAHGLRHGCFFTKHVFVRVAADGTVEARVIDLEKSHWRPVKTLCALRDLYSLNRTAFPLFGAPPTRCFSSRSTFIWST